MRIKILSLFPLLATLVLPMAGALYGQQTAFTYQGRLNNGEEAADGSYDFTFSLFATNDGGSAIAGPITNSAVRVSDGLFTTTLDFGSAVFNGDPLWLEIRVCTNGAGAFATLSPRQQLLPAPYAIFANTAAQLTGNALQQVDNESLTIASNTVNTATNDFVGTVNSMVQSATNDHTVTVNSIVQSATNSFPQLNTNSLILGTGQWHGSGTPGSFIFLPSWTNANGNIFWWFQPTNLPPGGPSINGTNWFQFATDGNMKFMAWFDPSVSRDVLRYGLYFNPPTWGHFSFGGGNLDPRVQNIMGTISDYTGMPTEWYARVIADTNGIIVVTTAPYPAYDAYSCRHFGGANTWGLAIDGEYGGDGGDSCWKSPYALRIGNGTPDGTVDMGLSFYSGDGVNETSPDNPGYRMFELNYVRGNWSDLRTFYNTNEGNLVVKGQITTSNLVINGGDFIIQGQISGYGTARTANSSFAGCLLDVPFIEGTGTVYHSFGLIPNQGHGYNYDLGTTTNYFKWMNGQSGYAVLIESNASPYTEITWPQLTSLGATSNWTFETVFLQPGYSNGNSDWPLSVSQTGSPAYHGAGIKLKDDGNQVLTGYFYSADGVEYTVSATVPGIMNSWHQAALTYDGQTLTLYVDGVATNSIAASGVLSTLSSGNVCVGSLQDGAVNCARIFNRCLNANDIRLHYREYFAP